MPSIPWGLVSPEPQSSDSTASSPSSDSSAQTVLSIPHILKAEETLPSHWGHVYHLSSKLSAKVVPTSYTSVIQEYIPPECLDKLSSEHLAPLMPHASAVHRAPFRQHSAGGCPGKLQVVFCPRVQVKKTRLVST
jgi:hypothetical protein